MLSRDQIISQLRQFFNVKELVCNHTYAKRGEASWQFLQTDYLHALLIIRRDILQVPMTCNHGNAYQRGLRCNMCEMVRSKTSVYLSPHPLGEAGDFTVQGMTAEQARRRIKAASHLLPCNIRLEAAVTWLHFDTMPQYGITQKVYEFKA